MVENYPQKITIYITEAQKEWVRSLPKSYNLTEKLRNCLQELIDESKKEN